MTLKNNILTLALLCSCFVYALPTDSIFIKMPQVLIPSLSPKQRFELAEYAKAGKKDSVTNLFNKKIILQKYDTATCSILLKTTETSSLEIRRLNFPSYKMPVLGVIHIVELPVKYATIRFYTESWQPLAIQLHLPSTEQWIDTEKLKASSLSVTLIKSMLDKKYFSFSFADNNELEVQNNVLSTLTKEERKTAAEFFINKSISIKIKK